MNTSAYRLSDKQYFGGKFPKTHFIIHHTAGNSVASAFNTWKQDTQRVGTSRIIDRNGDIYEVFPVESYAYALGMRMDNSSAYRNMPYDKDLWEKGGIQYELVSWGWLDKGSDGKYYSWAKTVVPEDEVEQVAFRNKQYWHKYTQAQIDTLRNVLKADAQKFGIALMPGSIADFFDDKRAEIGKRSPSSFQHEKTIFTHVNFRNMNDKTDCYPSSVLINMLSNINNSIPLPQTHPTTAASLLYAPKISRTLGTYFAIACAALALGVGAWMYKEAI